MDRHEHQLATVGRRPWPDCVVAVQCRMKVRYMSESDAVGTLTFTGWVASYGRVVGSTVDWRIVQTGSDPDSFWAWLWSKTMWSCRTFIYSVDARDQASAFGLWTLLGRGTLTLTGADPYYQQSGTDANRPRGNGYIVLENPPTVICWRQHETDTVYTWLDPANYGVKRPNLSNMALSCDDSPDPADLCDPAILASETGSIVRQVCGWFTAYARCLVKHDLNAPEHTAASQAMSGFRHSYLADRIVIHDSEPVLTLERDALHGGRCEARFVGDLFSGARPGELHATATDADPIREHVGPIYHLDVNSLYPAVAANALLPVRLMAIVRYPDLGTILEAAQCCAVVARVLVETTVPCLPVRSGKHTIYPVGRWQGEYCGPELLLAAANGAKLDVVMAAVYEARPIYRRWVETLYAAKIGYQLDDDKAMRCAVKGILNASFGKWAQRSKRWVPQPAMLPRAPYTQWFGEPGMNGLPVQYRAIAWQVQRLEDAGEPADSFPAITAYINSLGRVELWNLMRIAGPSEVWYYDTDSLFCSQAGYDRLVQAGLVDPLALGKLDVRGVYSHVRIIGRQAYLADGKLTLAACPEAVRAVGETRAKSLRSPPISHYLLRDQEPGHDRTVVSVRVRRPYEHGHVAADGTVTPIVCSPRPPKA